MRTYFVYILASERNGTLYVGFTSDLLQRVYAHKNDLVKGFTKKYGVHKLVYFETCDDYDAALQREKQIKEWKREWKLKLIEKTNPLCRIYGMKRLEMVNPIYLDPVLQRDGNSN